MPRRLRELRRTFKYANYLKQKNKVDVDITQYDAIHFHKTEDMYLCRESLERYDGKVILTSHTPCVPYKEIISRLNPKDYRVFKHKIDELEKMDRYAFERADYIIFPCEEAEEPYFHTWKGYSDIRIPQKYRYVPTGIVGCTAKVSREEIRERYGIPQEAFVVSYVGRHNEIKGYADLKEIGKKLLKDENVYFLIAGCEEPMHGLKDKHWIEVGWTDDPHSIISAADVFILPNRETYFDLILLEVISLGIPVVISDTGGNKFFRQFDEVGIKFFSSVDGACSVAIELKQMNRDARINAGKSLKALFDKYFTIQKFTENYIAALKDIF